MSLVVQNVYLLTNNASAEKRREIFFFLEHPRFETLALRASIPSSKMCAHRCVQRFGSMNLCTAIMCCFRLDLRAQRFSQMTHVYLGCWPHSNLRCLVNELRYRYARPQIPSFGHLYTAASATIPPPPTIQTPESRDVVTRGGKTEDER